MKNTQSYKIYYQTLNVEFDCNWKELRTGYKKAIQKWHPDRFEDGTEEKSAANEKIKAINIAYNHISSYYRENGSLPTIDTKPTERIQTKKAPSTPSEGSIDKKTYIKHKPKAPLHRSRNNTVNNSIFIITTVSIGAYIYFSNDFDEPSKKLESMTNKEIMLDLESSTLKHNTYIGDSHKIEQKQSTSTIKTFYFTKGSSIGDVINAQGLPTETNGDIWFYGDSEVHFKQGKVSHWVRSTNTPLKIKLK